MKKISVKHKVVLSISQNGDLTSHQYYILKVKRLDSYIALLTRWSDQRALQSQKWQLIGKSQWCCSANCGHPIARVNVQLDPRYAASKHTTAPINHNRPSPRKHSPDGATRARKQTSDYSLLFNRKDEKLSWPSWLTCSGRFTHISGHPSAAGQAQDREGSLAKDRRSTTLPRHQPTRQLW